MKVMDWTGRRVAVIGLGISNSALIRYLVRKGAKVTGCDQKPRDALGTVYDDLASLGIDFRLGDDYLADLEQYEAIFLTPGIRKDLPEIEHARRRGVVISSETELFFRLCRARIIGVTGSSGKTTTTTLIGEILSASGYDVRVGGNIGQPLIESVESLRPDQWVVLELSSFQLENLHASPDIALVTNISPNHLDHHGTMAAYVRAKKQIYRHQRKNGWLILNDDDGWADEMEFEAPGNVRRFSRRGPVSQGAYIDGDRVVIARSGQRRRTLEQVCLLSDIRLLGRHNLENVLAAVTVTDLCGVRLSTMRDVIASFTGVPHRLELVRDVWGVQYYNDSIATTPMRAVAGIESFSQPIVLIAGGYDKGLSFDPMVEALRDNVKALVTVGETAPKIEATLQEHAAKRPGNWPSVHRARSFEEAVEKAHALAAPGDVVLLSPGCASYGMFRNFEERGMRFRELVYELTEQPVVTEPPSSKGAGS